jgi:hypothetical protein
LLRKCDDLRDERWIEKIGSYLVRSANKENDLQARLGLKDDLSIPLDQRLEQIRASNTMQYIVPRKDGTPEYPPVFVRGAMRDDSITVGAALYTIARTAPELLRYVASAYSYAEQRMSVVLHGIEDATYGRKLIKLVNHLGISWLGVRLSGFRIGDPYVDLSKWKNLLELNQEIGRISGKNGNYRTAHHLRVDIINRRTQHLSGAFHSAMLWAYVVELWRIPRRAKAKFDVRILPAPIYTQRSLFGETKITKQKNRLLQGA